jgi:haloacid dehalogenase superfamily, subfamily IA, variant 3 with third motif having DD or ED/haloacid dehalogenase superfamily, subfamily IA, variant 1 with third motif having Dx(3-4)D or Dx(3-4)E
MNYDTVIFDLDGTLVNTLEDLAESVNAVLKSEGYQKRTIGEIQSFIGNGVQMLMTRSLPKGSPEKEIMRCLDLFRDAYRKNMFSKTIPYENVADTLKLLKEKEFKIGVVSNKRDEETKNICSFFFGQNIDVAIGDNHIRKKKPAPDNVFAALKELDSKQEKAIFVGDSNVDVETAKNADLICIGVTWGYRSRENLLDAGADFIIDIPSQLVPLIESLSQQNNPVSQI